MEILAIFLCVGGGCGCDVGERCAVRLGERCVGMWGSSAREKRYLKLDGGYELG